MPAGLTDSRGVGMSRPLKRGTVFEHRLWLDTKRMPLLCCVTSVRDGTVYWAEWEMTGIPEKGRHWFDLADADRYVGNVLQAAP